MYWQIILLYSRDLGDHALFRVMRKIYLRLWRSHRVQTQLKMTAICKFIWACNVSLSSRTFSFREKRERANLPYTENRDMVKYSFSGLKIWLNLRHFEFNHRNSSFRYKLDYMWYIRSINPLKGPTEGLPKRHKVLSRAVIRPIFQLFLIYLQYYLVFTSQSYLF
jgi:hypothetical protein